MAENRVAIVGLIVCGCLFGSLAGCYAPKADFESADPTSRLLAIKGAAKDADETAIPDLIRMLSSDDAAARLLAIRTLERLTGEDRGFDHSASSRDRQDAIDRWVAWYNETTAAGGVVSAAGTGGGTGPGGDTGG